MYDMYPEWGPASQAVPPWAVQPDDGTAWLAGPHSGYMSYILSLLDWFDQRSARPQ